jgi:hypothetical protein
MNELANEGTSVVGIAIVTCKTFDHHYYLVSRSENTAVANSGSTCFVVQEYLYLTYSIFKIIDSTDLDKLLLQSWPLALSKDTLLC